MDRSVCSAPLQLEFLKVFAQELQLQYSRSEKVEATRLDWVLVLMPLMHTTANFELSHGSIE